MHSAQLPYRELLGQLDGNDDAALEPIIGQWLKANTAESAWIVALGRVSESGIPVMSVEDLWRLYALSRVSDALITRLGKAGGQSDHYTTFMEGLGLRKITADCFHPFYHEVVEVTPSAAADTPITMANIIWPGFMCGALMISRAGVSVRGGVGHVRKEIAETSTLYWCFRRAGRLVKDLSFGWGSNSQWRTCFRRDYCLGGQYYYNVDADKDPIDSLLDERERLELLRHRCFVLSDRQHADLFPYDLRIHEPIA